MAKKECGCEIFVTRSGLLAKTYEESACVSMCRVHEAGPKLLTALKAWEEYENGHSSKSWDEVQALVQEAIAFAEGRAR